MIPSRALTLLCAAALLGGASQARAQEPAPAPSPTPEPLWKGSIGGGLAITTGNSDTNSYNLSFAAAYDPKRKNSLKSEGLYLRSTTTDVRTVDKTALFVRDEYKLSERSFVFADTHFFRDVLKGIDYLISPIAGAGVKLVNTKRTLFALDAGAGGQFERDQGRSSTSSGALQAGQLLTVKLSENANLTQRSSALWKMSDFGDALYRGELSIAASLARRFLLKLSFLDDYKTRPASPELEKNDISIVTSLVFKIG